MGTTVGKDREQPGKFAYELWDGFETVKREGGFATITEAQRAAEMAQRVQLFGAGDNVDDVGFSEEEFSDLLSELEHNDCPGNRDGHDFRQDAGDPTCDDSCGQGTYVCVHCGEGA